MAFEGQEVIGLIPARGGSKGIPRKNLTGLCGKPLIGWTIDAAKNCRTIDRVVVSSEDEEILEISSGLGAEIVKRPPELATDLAGSDGLIAHAIHSLGHDQGFDACYILLQPTSPLRTADHIGEAFALLARCDGRSLISVYEPSDHPMKAYLVDDAGYLKGMIDDETPHKPRQSLPKAYFANGAIYMFMANDFLTGGRIPSDRVIPYFMAAADSIDIDTPDDLEKAAEILEKRLETHDS